MPAAGKMPQRSFYMKKLLLVMLVPVLVLGLFSCGKVMDADMMPFELQGSWVVWDSTASADGNIVLVLSGNQATVYDKNNSDPSLTTATFRVQVTPTTVPKFIDGDTDNEISEANGNPGKITFYGFDDKKKKEIAHVSFKLAPTSTSVVGDVKTDFDNIYLYNLVRDLSANKSVLLPTAKDIDDPETNYTDASATKYTRLSTY
jgi:hypothetical protein